MVKLKLSGSMHCMLSTFQPLHRLINVRLISGFPVPSGAGTDSAENIIEISFIA
jgi:hypothetical protein